MVIMLSRGLKLMNSKTLRNTIIRNASDFGGSNWYEKIEGLQKEIKPLPEFFNRNAEINELRTIMKGVKIINIIRGPPNCGKTRLINETLRDYISFTSVNANLRSLGYNKGETFARYMGRVVNEHLVYSKKLKVTLRQ